MFKQVLYFGISHFTELMCHMEKTAWIKKLIQQSNQKKTILKLCVLVCPSAGNMSTKQVLAELVH